MKRKTRSPSRIKNVAIKQEGDVLMAHERSELLQKSKRRAPFAASKGDEGEKKKDGDEETESFDIFGCDERKAWRRKRKSGLGGREKRYASRMRSADRTMGGGDAGWQRRPFI